MIVTAEPYFAVTQPSDAVVMENFRQARQRKGIVEQVNAKYELLKRGQYTVNVPPSELQPIRLEGLSRDLFEPGWRHIDRILSAFQEFIFCVSPVRRCPSCRA